MIEEFEVFNKTTISIGTVYKYKFKLNDNTYYSEYWVIAEFQISVFQYYHEDPDYQTKRISFFKELLKEVKSFILKQKEIRLRHLMNPYVFL